MFGSRELTEKLHVAQIHRRTAIPTLLQWDSKDTEIGTTKYLNTFFHREIRLLNLLKSLEMRDFKQRKLA